MQDENIHFIKLTDLNILCKKVIKLNIVNVIFLIIASCYVNGQELTWNYNSQPSSKDSFVSELKIIHTPLSQIAIHLPTSDYALDNKNIKFVKEPSVWCYEEGCDYAWSIYGRGVLYLHSGLQLTLNIKDVLIQMNNPSIKHTNNNFLDFFWTYEDKYYRYKELDTTGSIFIYVFDVNKDFIGIADSILDSAKIWTDK